MIAPDAIKDSEQVQFEFKVTPMDNETPYEEDYLQKFSFGYMTECSGVSCLVRELVNPEPQTIVFYILIGVLVLYAARRGGRQGGEFYDVDEDVVSKEMVGVEEDDDDDLPAPVTYQEEDDDLELLEELEDL